MGNRLPNGLRNQVEAIFHHKAWNYVDCSRVLWPVSRALDKLGADSVLSDDGPFDAISDMGSDVESKVESGVDSDADNGSDPNAEYTLQDHNATIHSDSRSR